MSITWMTAFRGFYVGRRFSLIRDYDGVCNIHGLPGGKLKVSGQVHLGPRQ